MSDLFCFCFCCARPQSNIFIYTCQSLTYIYEHVHGILFCFLSCFLFLLTASHYSEFNDLYVLGRRLGKGHFATVYVARRREDNETYAVKIIDKTTLKQDEHEMMRSEMAILKVCVALCCVVLC